MPPHNTPQGYATSITDWPLFEQYLDEARFGFEQITPYLEELPANSKVLEVGSGPGFLLAQLECQYPQLKFTGVEPCGSGFDQFSIPLNAREPSLTSKIERTGYESLSTTNSYDLIFSINVFEHLPDWKDHLQFIRSRLTPSGTAVILCPNYGFPFETHFKMPILGSKRLTAKVMNKAITRFEAKNNAKGLWNSLNFVTLRAVEHECSHRDLEIRVCTDIISDMILRSISDPNFRQRQHFLSFAAGLLSKLGMVSIVSHRWLRWFHPYMKLELRRRTENPSALKKR